MLTLNAAGLTVAATTVQHKQSAAQTAVQLLATVRISPHSSEVPSSLAHMFNFKLPAVMN